MTELGEQSKETSNIANSINLRLAAGALMFFGIFVLAVGVGIFYFQTSKGEDIKIIAEDNEDTRGSLVVHVDGAVANPGVYSVALGARMSDVVQKAGGFTDDADKLKINLAAKVSDGQKVVVAKIGQSSATQVAGESTSRLININTATSAQLDELPGVGPVTIGKIIAARPYVSVNELTSKRVVSASVFAKISDLISVD